MKILLLMSGSIACAKASGLISLWVKNGHQVKVVCTQSVFEFVGKATVEGLSGNRVHSSVFSEGQMMEHIHLSRWADCLVFAPVTANSINKITTGIADDMVTSTWIAAFGLGKPLYIAPAMNAMMWNYPATQQSISTLKNWGVTVLLPESGDLACGEIGAGRLMEIDAIDAAVMKQSQKIRSNGKNILITAGGTREYVDGVRYIGNLSTGKTGAEVADYFTSHGYQVTWLGAITAVRPKLGCTIVSYETFDDLFKALKHQLTHHHFEMIIHAAAISDFSVSSIKINDQDIIACRNTKLPSSDSMDLRLKKNPKLVSQLLKWSQNLDLKVVAFKLTNTQDAAERQKAVNKLINQNGIDWVAHNDLSEIKGNSHPFTLYSSETDFEACSSTQELCQRLSQIHTIHPIKERKSS